MFEELQKELKKVGLYLLEEYEIVSDALTDIHERVDGIEKRLHKLEERQKKDKQNERIT